jgi:hypothetical protein
MGYAPIQNRMNAARRKENLRLSHSPSQVWKRCYFYIAPNREITGKIAGGIFVVE